MDVDKKYHVVKRCAFVVENYIKEWRRGEKLANADAKKARRLQTALQKCSEWDPTTPRLAAHAMAIEHIRKAVFEGIMALKEFCLLRRVSREWRDYIDTFLTPQLKMILKNEDPGLAENEMRKLTLARPKPNCIAERNALEAKLVAEFGPNASATIPAEGEACIVPQGRHQYTDQYTDRAYRKPGPHNADKLDAAVRRSQGKTFCQLTSAMRLGAVAFRCETSVLPGAGLSKDALCQITGLTPSSSAQMWSDARNLGILDFRSGKVAKGCGWRAGGAWEGWLGSRVKPRTCPRADCNECSAFRTLLMPRCTYEAEISPHTSSTAQRRGAGVPAWAAYQRDLSAANVGKQCGGCSGHCDAWGSISIMRDCLAVQSNSAARSSLPR